MNTNTYLSAVLRDQALTDDGPEMRELRCLRGNVETLLTSAFHDADLTIRYGGSKAKGTMIREAYDLDIAAYFANGDDTAGTTLQAIYRAVCDALARDYYVEEKTSALRLRNKEPESCWQDFHVDVVPGRFTDATRTDCYLHQSDSDKDRLKTNLDVHIAHVRDSGVRDALRLLKLFRVRRDLPVKQFAFELLAIKLLEGRANETLAEQFRYVLDAIATAGGPPTVEDPANPAGNDLSPLLRGTVWRELQDAAARALSVIDAGAWTQIFGDLAAESAGETAERALAAPAVIATPVKPWAQ